MTSSHSQTIRTFLFPDQNHSRNPKHQKSSQIDSHLLPGVNHRQAIQTKPRKLGGKHMSPGGQGYAARRFPLQEPRIHSKIMSLLATMN